jgi:hypothetical protein
MQKTIGTPVSDFADEYEFKKNIVLFDASAISPDFLQKLPKLGMAVLFLLP